MDLNGPLSIAGSVFLATFASVESDEAADGYGGAWDFWGLGLGTW